MTAETLAAPTTTPTAGVPRRKLSRRGALPWVVLAVLTALAVTAIVIAAPRGGQPLDPRSPTPEGSRAIAEVLRGRGVQVTRVTTVGAASTTNTFVVPYPRRLDDADLSLLRDAMGPVVLVDPSQHDLDVLGLPLESNGDLSVGSRPPGCALPAAVRAGTVSAGGTAFAVIDDPRVQRCYDDTLLTLGRYSVLGSGSVLTNNRLDQDGNAALALGLLDHGAPVAWVLPTGAQARETSGDGSSALTGHLPDGVIVGIWQVMVAVVLLALARGRRLGPPVAEQLPVSVRAAETVEGRARLYRAARARSTAADALREGARRRLAARLTPGSGAGDPAALVRAVASRTGRDPGEIASLLYGPGTESSAASPLDDAGLLRLTAELETLDRQVRRT